MIPFKARELRIPVHLTASVQIDEGWADVQITDISSRGIAAVCSLPPARGTYIEVRHGDFTAVGRVAWQRGDHFGLRTRERIDFTAFKSGLTGSTLESKLPATKSTKPAPQFRRIDVAAQTERSRWLSSAMGFCAISLAAVLAALILADAVRDIMARSVGQAGEIIAGTNAEGRKH